MTGILKRSTKFSYMDLRGRHKKERRFYKYYTYFGYDVWRLDIAGFGRSEAVTDGFLPDSGYAAEDIGAAVEKIVEIRQRGCFASILYTSDVSCRSSLSLDKHLAVHR